MTIFFLLSFSVGSICVRSKMAQSKHDWIDLITEMLWVIDRETKFTLRGINDDFIQSELSFDAEFRKHFLNIIQNR